MTLKHFIERPVLASVISIVIVIAGLIGLATLPVEQYPDIAPPTGMVRASYPGASAETIQKSVIVPLEQAINGVEDMTYMTSSAAVGSASVTIYFRQGTNADMAAVNVQNKVSRATGQLPSEVTQIGIQTMKRQTSMVKIFSLYSPDASYDEFFLANYSKINIEPRIQRIHGVGEVFTLGADYSMRVWLKPDIMAQYKLIPSDVTAALAEQNIESATGTLGENSQNTFQYTMKYRGRHQTPEEFGEIVILAKSDGTILRLKDIADIELGSESYAYKGYTNGHPGVSTMIFQTAGSNATQVVNDVNALLDEVQAELPKGVAIAHLQSVNDFLYASMKEVVKTLFEAILLVILVVYVFLQDIRSTLIPTASILVSLIGTFGVMLAFGFSLNMMTLLGLILAIGIVVDGQLYYGKSGFAGEFGHIPFFDNEIICSCGKKGCLETEVSGIAIEDKMSHLIERGVNTILKEKYDKQKSIHIDDIIAAAKNDDNLSIELIEEAGEKVGKAVAFLINTFNPETVIVGGNMAAAGDYIMLPLKSATNKYSLNLVYKDTKFRVSKMTENANAWGVAMLIRNKIIGI